MKDKVLYYIKRYNLIENGDKIVLGISGGPDSVCLLHILSLLKPELNIDIHAVHVNHMLRGDEADADERYVEALCRGMNIPLQIISADIGRISRDEGISLEEAGRRIRYEQFDLTAGNVGAGKIAVAHNKNDQAETVLMHIMRGTGLEGLRGMQFKRGKIIRPLLGIERSEIENYCKENKLSPRTDSTNLENVYTRNRIRNELIPFIREQFNTDITKNIFHMAQLLADDNEFIEVCAAELFNDCVILKEKSEIGLDFSRMKLYHAAVRKRVVRNAIKEVKGDLKNIEDIHIEDIIDLIYNGRTGSRIHLPGGIRALKSYDFIKIYMEGEQDTDQSFDETVSIPGITHIGALKASIEAFIIDDTKDFKECRNVKNESLTQFFDYDKTYVGITIRNRKNGDVFKPYKSNGTKKLKEYLIDNKIPKDKRDRMPFVASGNEIVWIIGNKISDKFKVTENTKCVLKLIYRTDVF